MRTGIQLPVQNLSGQSFTSFGTVITMPPQPSDAAGPGWHWWSDTALLPGGDPAYGVGYLSLDPSALRFDWAEQHMRSGEMIVPVGGDCLIYVGLPQGPIGQELPDLERFQVFRLQVGQAVILKPGIWHGAPFALNEPLSVIVLLLQNTGRGDTKVVRFSETPVTIVP